jgi:mRNA-degrading endonuclease toxin of MazEF toxin-antitoxin module
MKRGDVILVRFPHPSGVRGKKRPAVIVQSDSYLGSVRTLVIAEITTNLALARDAACLFIDIATPDGKRPDCFTTPWRLACSWQR